VTAFSFRNGRRPPRASTPIRLACIPASCPLRALPRHGDRRMSDSLLYLSRDDVRALAISPDQARKGSA